MRLAQAIKTGFLRSFQYSGRASRSEYWFFLPIGVLLPFAAFGLLHFLVPQLSAPQSLCLAALTLVPLAAVTARRLADLGTNPTDLHPLLGGLVVFLGTLLLFWHPAPLSFLTLHILSGSEFGLLLVPLFVFGFYCLLTLSLIASLCVTAFSCASLLGQMVLPSSPGPNRYGPNPTEVQS